METSGQHRRTQSDQATLDDAKAMLHAAEGDASVARKLTPRYLAKVRADVAEGERLLQASTEAKGAQLDQSAHVGEGAQELLTVMSEIRDAVQFAGEPDAIQVAFGRGAAWDAHSPGALVAAAHGMVAAFAAHPRLASEAGIDAQHRHDLAHLADALDEAHQHHVELRQARGDTTAARRRAFALLRAEAHHVRLAARLLHRREPEKLARFESPVSHHRVVHRAPVGGAAPAASG
jgi:hypothetical protein